MDDILICAFIVMVAGVTGLIWCAFSYSGVLGFTSLAVGGFIVAIITVGCSKEE